MTPVAIGIDIGGSKISAALVDATGEVYGTPLVCRTPALDGPARIVSVAASVAEEMRDAHARTVDTESARSSQMAIDLRAVGVGTAGVVGPDGIVVSATESLPGWAGVDMRRQLEAAIAMPVVVLNDVHAACRGEAIAGAGRHFSSFLMVTVGTGIGGALCRHGVPEFGATGTAGSLGHTAARCLEPRECPCGQWGHLEAYASGPAIERAYERATDRVLSLRQIAERLASTDIDDPIAVQVIADGAHALGVGLADAMNLVDLQAVVIGGGVAQIGDRYLDQVRAAYRHAALPGPSKVPMAPAQLGTLATVIGAGLAALDANP